MTHISFPAPNQRTITFESITVAPHSAIIKCIFLAVLIFVLPTAASAQEKCAAIGSDPEWAAGLKQIVDTMQAEDWQTAKQQAKALSLICPSAPTLNYLRGRIAEQLNEKQEALYYFQNASESTYTFAVDPDTAKKIWYARYESEHPERTASALELNNETLSALEAKNAHLQELNMKTYKKLLWTGVGIGAGGLVMAGTGAALVAISHSSNFEKTDNDRPYKVTDNPVHATGWILTGLGSGILITGAILAGVYGHKYKQSLNDNYTFNISPNSISFSVKF